MSPSISLFGIYRDARMDEAALEVLHSGQIASGAYVKKFSDGFAALTGQQHLVTVNDMSSAIQIALHLSGVRAGDEVLTVAYACMSTNAPIATLGARPVWVDVDATTGLMDPAALERAITPRAKAVIVYHLAGYPADIQRIAAICRERNLVLIEDCDNALLARVGDSQVGSFGDFAVYSFYPNRQINATEGGALACRRLEDAERATRLRRYGIDLPRFRDAQGEIDPRCDIAEVGWAATLNNLCSAIGYTQLDSVAARVERGREMAAALQQRLAGMAGVNVVPAGPGAVCSHWALLVRLQQRDAVLAGLKRRGVAASKLHHRTDTYSGFNAPSGDLPQTARFLDEVLGLPCGWWLQRDDVDAIATALAEAIAEAAKP